MDRRVPMSLRASSLVLAAVALFALLPSTASGQGQCKIAVQRPEKGACKVTMCAQDGNFDYKWGGPGLPSGAFTQCVSVGVSGTYVLLITDRDTHKQAKCSATVFVDKCANRPPDCSAAHAKQAVVWPPNHQMETIEIEGVTDPDGDPVLVQVFGVTQDEPLDTNGDGSTCADAEIVDGVASVRAERTGDPDNPGNGRVYVLSFIATDAQGAQCSGQITVCVPHDMGQGDTCIDDGQIYDSLGDCP